MYFKDVIGQNDVKSHLIDSVKRGLVPHARLLYGAEGVGKMALAIAYARYLNCESPLDNDACGNCPSCQKIDNYVHPDLHFVFPVVKSKVCDEYLPEWRSFISENKYFNINDWLSYIDSENAQGLIYAKESDEILRKLSLKSYEGKYKIMIVWLPERMHEVCANKLLKLIEEPPENTIFLLVAEELEKVIQTIRSRCQLLYVGSIADKDMNEALCNIYGLDTVKAQSFVHIARGSFTEAKQIIKSAEEENSFFELFKEMMRASFAKNIKSIKAVANTIAAIGREAQKNYLLYCLRLFREYFVSNLQEPDMVYLNEEELLFGERFSSFINERNIEDFNQEFSLAHRQIEQNGNAKIIFLDLCLKTTLFLKN